MPKILGLNIVGVILATVVFYIVGGLWYGMLFQDAWMSAAGITEASFENESPSYMAGGVLITFIQVIGIGLALNWKGVSDLGGAIKAGLVLWFFFAFPFTMYAYLYNPEHSPTLLMIDASHMLVGWVASAAILSFFK